MMQMTHTHIWSPHQSNCSWEIRAAALLTGEIAQQLPPSFLTQCQIKELDSWNVMKFGSTKGRSGLEIMKRLTEHDPDDALSHGNVYHWINIVRVGRKDLFNIGPPGRGLMKLFLPDRGNTRYKSSCLGEGDCPGAELSWDHSSSLCSVVLGAAILSCVLGGAQTDEGAKSQTFTNCGTHVAGAGGVPELNYPFPFSGT
jgi:hypothetical protein